MSVSAQKAAEQPSPRLDFDLLRYFTRAGFVVVAGVLVVSGLLVIWEAHNVYVQIEQDEADSLNEAILARLAPIGLDERRWGGQAETSRVRRELNDELSNFNVLEFQVFTLEGETLACVGAEAARQPPAWEHGFSAAQAGRVATRWEAEAWWQVAAAVAGLGDRNVMVTYAPVKEDRHVTAVAKIRRDMAKTLTRMHILIEQVVLLGAAAAGLVFVGLRVVVRKADAVLRAQRATIEDINRRLGERNWFLEESDARKDEFLSICSHDIRSPLMGVAAGCQLLLKGKQGALNSAQREIVENSARNVQSVVRLTEALLDVARIENGTEALNLELFDPVQVVRESLQAHHAQAESRGVVFDLSAPNGATTIQADRFKILRVCNNLISNAVKHSRQGAVRVSVERTACSVSIRIVDCGPGIKSEHMARLFDRFSALSRGKRTREEGTGLGLFITRALVELHGGRIEVSSNEGQGAAFTVLLPLAVGKRTAAQPA